MSLKNSNGLNSTARTLLLLLLILLMLGLFPAWPYSAAWGYYPFGGAGLLLIVFIVLLVADVI